LCEFRTICTVSFSAANPLNQATLTEFTRQGLARLQVETIQTVKVYGLQQEELPNWISTFQIGLEVIPESPEQTGFWGGNLASLVSSLGDRWSKVSSRQLNNSRRFSR
jgi:hypothetical protein